MKNKAAQELGKLGGLATAKKRTHKDYVEQGRKGALKRWGIKRMKASSEKNQAV